MTHAPVIAAWLVLACLGASGAAAAADVSASMSGAVSLPNCTSAGGEYDLTALAGAGLLTYTDPVENYTYALHVCGVANAEAKCAAAGAAICQYNVAPPSPAAFVHALGLWDGTAVWNNCTDPTACPNGGAQVLLANGDHCGGDGPSRQVTFLIGCNAAATGAPTGLSVTVSADNRCWYTVALQHASGCPVPGGGGGSGGNDSGGGGALSVGSLFLIVLAVFAFAYVVGGCVYNRSRGATGFDACPNAHFWRALPQLCADGCRYALNGCLRLCGRGGDVNYGSMK